VKKRRLSQTQQRNIRQRHAELAQREGLREGVIVSHHGKQLLIEDLETGQRLRGYPRQTLGALTTGDRIRWVENKLGEASVEVLLPRQSLLVRPDSHGKARLMAANLDQVLIVVAPLPTMNPFVIDQAIVATLDLPARPLIVLNKSDLLYEVPANQLFTELAEWRKVGFDSLQVSAKTGEGLDKLHEALKDHTSLLVGMSGVGKSSLTRQLSPQAADIAIAEISDHSQEGRHTTRTSTLYHLPAGGMLIDAPGVRDFGIYQLNRQTIERGFPEIQEHASDCRFANCSHQHEPGCAVRRAVENGTISARRFESYSRLMAQLAGS